MTGFDQAQSARLGQKTPIESTTITMFNGDEIPEAAWDGQMIYRPDRQVIEIYRSETGAFEDVVGGTGGLLTFVGSTRPVAQNVGDLWYDTDNGHALSRWDGTDWILVPFGTGALEDGAVTTPKVADNAITTIKVTPYAITNQKIDDFAVTVKKFTTTTHFIY